MCTVARMNGLRLGMRESFRPPKQCAAAAGKQTGSYIDCEKRYSLNSHWQPQICTHQWHAALIIFNKIPGVYVDSGNANFSKRPMTLPRGAPETREANTPEKATVLGFAVDHPNETSSLPSTW